VGTGNGAVGGCIADPGAELLLLFGWTLSEAGDPVGAGDPVASGVAGRVDGLERGPGAEDPLACEAGDRCTGAERAIEKARDPTRILPIPRQIASGKHPRVQRYCLLVLLFHVNRLSCWELYFQANFQQ
jgi:hypothetical protein